MHANRRNDCDLFKATDYRATHMFNNLTEEIEKFSNRMQDVEVNNIQIFIFCTQRLCVWSKFKLNSSPMLV